MRAPDARLALGLTVVGAITRVIAIPASLWEWDDVLFAQALHQFDISEHIPHPPGFPVFVMLGRAAYAVLGDEHLAYAVISCLFTSLLPAGLFYFYREIFRDSTVAFAGALIGSFAPNVWVYSAASRSDGPALTLGIIGLTLVLRGVRSPRALLIAGLLFGVSMGVRVTVLFAVGLLLACVLLARLRATHWRLVGGTLGLGIAGCLSWYVPLVLHNGWHAYHVAISEHARYTYATDSFFAEGVNAVSGAYRLQRFFVSIWGARTIMWTMYICAAGGLVLLAWRRQWRAIGELAVCFLPIMAFTVLVNTPLSAPLYSLSYVPLFVGLAGFSIVTAPRLLVQAGRWPGPDHIGLVLTSGVVVGMIHWSYPIIEMLRSEVSPPVRAAEYLRRRLDPSRDTLYYEPVFVPHVRLYFPDLKARSGGLVQCGSKVCPDLNLIDPPVGVRSIYALTEEPGSADVGGTRVPLVFHPRSRTPEATEPRPVLRCLRGRSP